MPNNKVEGEFILNKKPRETSTENEAAIVNLPNAKHKAYFYSNLVLNPENVTLENPDADESIVLLVRRDLITNVPWIFFAILFILIPPVISLFSSFFTPFFNFSGGVILIAILFYYLIVVGFILIEFTLWYFNIGLVTTKRIVDFDVYEILSKHVGETRLNLIQDVSYSKAGSIRTIFNYGDVHMQTAGTLANFEFDRAPDPARIVRIIADMAGRGSK